MLAADLHQTLGSVLACCSSIPMLLQVRHCNSSLKHTEACYYEELAEGFCRLVSGCKAEPQVRATSCPSFNPSDVSLLRLPVAQSKLAQDLSPSHISWSCYQHCLHHRRPWYT